MYLLYIDISGTPEQQDSSRAYVAPGLCVHERYWHQIPQRIEELIRDWRFPAGAALELHAKDLCSDIRTQHEVLDFEGLDFSQRASSVLELQQGKIERSGSPSARQRRRKRYRGQKPYVHLSRRERRHLYRRGLEIVGASHWRLFTEIVDKAHFAAKSPRYSIVEHAWMQLVTRFDHFLERQKKRGSAQKGILIVDKEPTRELLIREQVSQWREDGHPWGRIRHVIESPFFVDSADAPAIQLADLCAYAVRRYVTRRGPYEEDDFTQIVNRFDRASGKLHGARHFCAEGSCDCRICFERGHSLTKILANPARA